MIVINTAEECHNWLDWLNLATGIKQGLACVEKIGLCQHIFKDILQA